VLDLLAAALEALKAGADARTQLELALLKAASPEADTSLSAILDRMMRLEAAQGTGGGPPPSVPLLKEPPPANGNDDLTLERLRGVWPAILDRVRSSNALLAAVIDHAQPVELAGERLVLAFQETDAFLRRKAEDRANRSAVTDAVRTVTGRAFQLAYELRQLGPAAAEEPLSEDEWVSRLKEEFDAEELEG
jgi:hypothetical protein